MKLPLKSKAATAKGRHFILTAPLGFVSLALLWCQVGYLTPTFSRAMGGLLWLLVVYLAADSRRLLWTFLSAVLLFNPIGAVHRPEGLWLLGLLPWAGGACGRRWMGAAWLAALGGWLWANSPGLWVGLDEFVADFSAGLSGANLSSAAAGVPLLALGVCFPLAAMLAERRFLAPLISAAGLLLALLLYWWLMEPLSGFLHRHGAHFMHNAFSLQWALIVLLGLFLMVWAVLDPPRAVRRQKKGAVIVPAFALIGAVLVGWPPSVGVPQLNREVVFYNKGYLNWNLPVYGAYGRGSTGMFGLVPKYLSWRGFSVSMEDSLSADVLGRTGVVVITNLKDPLSEAEETALHRFVEKGGSLLLLGDHTGMANIREPSNQVLAPYGIELNFDSAKPKRTGWAGSLVTVAHPLTSGLGLERQGGDSPGITQIWVGASLAVSPPGKPVIMGRDGFSDIGDERNEKDGFLGDYRYRTHERLGNQVLLTEAYKGEGKVLVFGDTSTLQNGALMRSGDFVERIFEYLLSDVNQPPRILKTLGLVILIGALLVWAFSGAGTVSLALGALALFFGAGICQQKTAGLVDRIDQEWTVDAYPRALVDHSHAPRSPLNLTSVDGTWGLHNCLLRSEFLPRTMERWDEKALYDAGILLEIAPTKRLDRGERETISRFMQNGGLVILCCGFEEFDGSESILKDYGLKPLNVPLGPAEVQTFVELPLDGSGEEDSVSQELNVRFHEAWEVGMSDPSTEVILDAYEKPVIVYRSAGEGGLLYIADTDFLANLNLESPSAEYHEPNILYLRYLLWQLAGGK